MDYARRKAFIDKYGITEGSQDLNVDKCRFSFQEMTLGRSKCVVQNGRAGIRKDPKCRAVCEQGSMMPVIIASQKVLKPLFVLL